MAYEDHLNFLDILDTSMFYALDEKEKNSEISSEKFFERIYMSFSKEDEVAIKKTVQDANDFTVITAPLGGGKTTTIRNALQEYINDKNKYLLFDFKKEIEGHYNMGDSTEDRISFIYNLLKEKLWEEFLQDLDVKIDFIWIALVKFFKEKRVHNIILKYRAKHKNPKIGNDMQALKTIFCNDYEKIAEEEIFVRKELNCSQTIVAIKETLKVEKFLIILDNVDRLKSEFQPIVFSIAIDLHHGGEGAFGIIVALRSNNLIRFEEAGVGGDIIRIVSLSSNKSIRCRPKQLHPQTEDIALGLLEKRHKFALKFRSASEDVKESKQLFKQIGFHVNKKFIEEKFYNLSNHSYRQMLSLNLDFIHHLFRLVEANAILNKRNELFLTENKLLSYLYRWMYVTRNSNPNHEFLLDIVKKYEQYNKGSLATPLSCDIELVILIWLSNNNRKFLRIQELINALHSIGIKDESLIFDSLYRLYDVDLSHRYIELGGSEDRLKLKDIDENTRITLLPLGEEFSKSIITKFEFLYQCLAYPYVTSPDAPEILTPISEGIDRKVEKIISFMHKMKKAHTDSLLKIREACNPIYPNWEEYYRQHFCINNSLIIERTVFSHLKHLKEITNTENFEKYNEKYMKLLDEYYRSFGSSREVRDSYVQ
ncbi:MAG: hypothetical protein PHE49_06255 [bacterium]|nr:hypothetical protein [bacterium]